MMGKNVNSYRSLVRKSAEKSKFGTSGGLIKQRTRMALKEMGWYLRDEISLPSIGISNRDSKHGNEP